MQISFPHSCEVTKKIQNMTMTKGVLFVKLFPLKLWLIVVDV